MTRLVNYNGANSFDVIIAGGGPAGCSAAIHLANHGIKVLLVEQKRFPREKLCGEFISPECARHFEQLGIEIEIKRANPANVIKTVFYARGGNHVAVPSEWFGSGTAAMGLSRAQMDHELLGRARTTGAVVLEDATVCDLLSDGDCVTGIRLKSGNEEHEYRSLVTIDATGRARALARRLKSDEDVDRKTVRKSRFVAFKVHVADTREARRTCEIYSYPGGYGGLSPIENGLTNLCFIAAASDVRECDSDPNRVVKEIVSKNRRAAYTLSDSRVCSEWLSVALNEFGRRSPTPCPGLLAIGDAASFIDPFTGSGILMALESGELAAKVVLEHIDALKPGVASDLLASHYAASYQSQFDSRLRASGLLRWAAFVPYAAEAAVLFFSTSKWVRRKFARATRSSTTERVGVKT
jgi:geranylgeranyl reductase family protein